LAYIVQHGNASGLFLQLPEPAQGRSSLKIIHQYYLPYKVSKLCYSLVASTVQ